MLHRIVFCMKFISIENNALYDKEEKGQWSKVMRKVLIMPLGSFRMKHKYVQWGQNHSLYLWSILMQKNTFLLNLCILIQYIRRVVNWSNRSYRAKPVIIKLSKYDLLSISRSNQFMRTSNFSVQKNEIQSNLFDKQTIDHPSEIDRLDTSTDFQISLKRQLFFNEWFSTISQVVERSFERKIWWLVSNFKRLLKKTIFFNWSGCIVLVLHCYSSNLIRSSRREKDNLQNQAISIFIIALKVVKSEC